MTKKLYIVGAGGFAREIYRYLEQDSFQIGGYTLEGFLDDNASALENKKLEHSIVGKMLSHDLASNSALLMGLASPSLKEKIFQFYSEMGISFITFIHKSSFVGKLVEVGPGTIIAPNCTITSDINIGCCCTINANSSIGHDAVIGDFSSLSGHCDVTGHVKIGQRVLMGSHALIIPNVKIEDDSVVGAGSVVISKVKAGSTVFGNPAKKIK